MSMTAESGVRDVPEGGTRLILPTLIERANPPVALITPSGEELPLPLAEPPAEPDTDADTGAGAELDVSVISVPADIERADDGPQPSRELETVTLTKPADVDAGEVVGESPEPTVEAAEPGTEAAEVVSPAKTFRVFSLIDPDRRWVMIVAMVLMTSVLTANLVTSFTNVYAMAAWIGVPVEVQWLPVVILDVAIVGFSWGLMVFKSRGAPVRRTRIYIGVVTGFSVVANFMHTYDHWHGQVFSPQAMTGITFSSCIPLLSLVTTEELIRLVFQIRDRRKQTLGDDQ